MAVQYPFVLAVIFLCLSVTLLAQAAITIYTYNTEKREKDLNFYWSCAVLTGAIIGTLASLGAMFMNRGSAKAAVSGVMPGAGAVPSAAAVKAQAEALANLEEAQAAAVKALGPVAK
jgi:hypothetical protein